METDKQDNTPAQGVKLDLTGLVKPLEWKSFEQRQQAFSRAGPYTVVCYSERDWGWSSEYSKGREATEQAAKAAAQADYTARILSALDLDAIAALVGANKALIDFHNGPTEAKRPDIFLRILQRINAALARLGGVE
jgi:hypothetical protein